MTSTTAPWIAFYELAARGLEKTLDGISDAEAVVVPLPGINSVNWLVGHILLYRDRIHEVLALEPAWPERLGRSDQYWRGSAPAGRGLPVALSSLRAELERSQHAVLVRLAELGPEEWERPASLTRTVGEQLALFGAHDFYHLGQLGMVRRLLGKPPALG